MSEPDRFPSNPARFPAARGAQRWAKAERERRVVEGLNGGLSMAEIARREEITERGLRKYVRNLIARRAPEATGEFIAVQMSRLNEALLVSFGAMSGANLPAVDRVVKIVRELDRYQGLSGGAQGTETRRKLLESLDSGAGIAPVASPFGEGGSGEASAEDAAADRTPELDAFLADCLPPLRGPGEPGTETRRNLLKSLDLGAAAMQRWSPLADEA